MIDTIAAIIFIVVLAIFLLIKRKQVVVQKALFPILYVVMYRSSLGLKAMSSWAKKFPRVLDVLAKIGVVVGFIGMLLVSFEIVAGSFKLITTDSAPGIQPVLPFEAKGVFFVPFLYWIISIFLLAVVHEFAHGVISRLYNIPVKSSGFAFLCAIVPIVPAAFVEPDEKMLSKRKAWHQLGVFAAGPFSNFLFALLIFGAAFALTPVVESAFHVTGLELASVVEGGPLESKLAKGDVISSIDGTSVTSADELTAALQGKNAGDEVLLATTKGDIQATLASHPQNESKPFLGVTARPHVEAKQEFVEQYGDWSANGLQWFSGLLVWLMLLNVGIGLFNLLPIGPLDGGRMFQLVCLKLFKKETASKIMGMTSLAFMVLIIANIVVGVLR